MMNILHSTLDHARSE